MSNLFQTASKIKNTLFNENFSLFSNTSKQPDAFKTEAFSFKDVLKQECSSFSSSQESNNNFYEQSRDNYETETKDTQFSQPERYENSSRQEIQKKEKKNDNRKEEKTEKIDNEEIVASEAAKTSEIPAQEKTKAEEKIGAEEKGSRDEQGEASKTSENAKENATSEQEAKDEDGEAVAKNNENNKSLNEALNIKSETSVQELAETDGKTDGKVEVKAEAAQQTQNAIKAGQANTETIETKNLEKTEKSQSNIIENEMPENLKNPNSGATANISGKIAASILNKQNNGAKDKSSASKQSQADLSQLEKNTGVVIKKMTIENNGANNNQSGNNADPKDILRSLLNNQNQQVRATTKNAPLNEQSLENMESKGTKNILSEMIKNSQSANIKTAGSAKNILRALNGDAPGQAIDAKQAAPIKNMSATEQFAFAEITQSNAKMMSQAATQASSFNPAANITLVQELIGKMQGMLKGSNLDGGSKLSMNFDSGSYGPMSMTLQQKGSSLAISLEVGNESSREQLMNQRDELAQHLRQMGYKNVALDVSGGRRENDAQENKNKKQGNDLFANVKLAGDDEHDKAMALENALL